MLFAATRFEPLGGDEPRVQRCRSHPDAADIRYISGTSATRTLTPKGFDLVSAVAALHHMDAREGLLRLRSLVSPGGVLVVVGLARSPRIRPLCPAPIWPIVRRAGREPSHGVTHVGQPDARLCR
jgi:2-polyprenyl-3-methyl-5-hydroxy-6-metoxy-1,4-benzoquinol methylase